MHILSIFYLAPVSHSDLSDSDNTPSHRCLCDWATISVSQYLTKMSANRSKSTHTHTHTCTHHTHTRTHLCVGDWLRFPQLVLVVPHFPCPRSTPPVSLSPNTPPASPMSHFSWRGHQELERTPKNAALHSSLRLFGHLWKSFVGHFSKEISQNQVIKFVTLWWDLQSKYMQKRK